MHCSTYLPVKCDESYRWVAQKRGEKLRIRACRAALLGCVFQLEHGTPIQPLLTGRNLTHIGLETWSKKRGRDSSLPGLSRSIQRGTLLLLKLVRVGVDEIGRRLHGDEGVGRELRSVIELILHDGQGALQIARHGQSGQLDPHRQFRFDV